MSLPRFGFHANRRHPRRAGFQYQFGDRDDAPGSEFAEDVIARLEHAPATLRRLFEGRNPGKQLLKVADAPLAVPPA